MRIYKYAFLVMLFCQFVYASPSVENGTIYINESNQLHFNAHINRDTFNRLVAVYDGAKKKPDTIVVTSEGGEASASIDAGFWMAEKALHLIVQEYCFSGCANYLLPAARSITMDKNVVLYWHGSMRSAGLKERLWAQIDMLGNMSLEEKERAKLQANSQVDFLIERERDLYKLLEVDPDLPLYGHLQACNIDAEVALGDKNFYYSIEDLKMMGMKNITVKGDLWAPEKTELFKAKNIYKAVVKKSRRCLP